MDKPSVHHRISQLYATPPVGTRGDARCQRSLASYDVPQLLNKLRPKPVGTKENPSEPFFALFCNKEMSGSHKTATVAAPEGSRAASQCSHRCSQASCSSPLTPPLPPEKMPIGLCRFYKNISKKTIIRLEVFKMDLSKVGREITAMQGFM